MAQAKRIPILRNQLLFVVRVTHVGSSELIHSTARLLRTKTFRNNLYYARICGAAGGLFTVETSLG